MKKIELLAMLGESKDIIDYLQRKGTVQVEKCDAPEAMYYTDTDSSVSQLERLLQTAENARETISFYSPEKKKLTDSFLPRKEVELTDFYEDKEKPGMNGGQTDMTGFAHNAVLSRADEIVALVKQGKIKHFFLIGGCDGASPSRSYYTDFAKATPPDSLILTLACGKYRINDLDLGTIEGIPRILDCGQCNDAYSAIRIALALADAFGCSVNDLPLTLVLSWYEQKAVCILLTLLYLGIKNIFLGPTLPAFGSPGVLDILVKNYNITPTNVPEKDLAKALGRK